MSCDKIFHESFQLVIGVVKWIVYDAVYANWWPLILLYSVWAGVFLTYICDLTPWTFTVTKILHGYTCSFIIIIKWHCFSRFAFLYRGIIPVIKAIQFSHLTYSIANSLHLFWNPCVVCCYNYCCWTNFSNYEFHEPIIKMRSYSCDFMTTRIVLLLFFYVRSIPFWSYMEKFEPLFFEDNLFFFQSE